MAPRKSNAWPPIPATVSGILGPIPVTRVAGLTDDAGEACGGLWSAEARTIEIHISGSPVNEWHTFWHEWTHAVLDDLRVTLPTAQEEAVCDAVAVARTREMAEQLGLKAPARKRRRAA